MKEVIQIPGAPAPIGPYSQAVLVNDTLYVSGQIPADPVSGDLVLGSIEKSTTRVMENIMALVKAAGMSSENIVKCSIFMKDLGEFDQMNEIYASYFRSSPPARETVQVSRLPKDVNIEISCIAVK